MDSIVTAIEGIANLSGVYMAFMSVLTAIIGLVFILISAMKMREMGNGRQSEVSVSIILSYFVVGICFLSFGTFLTFGSMSIFGDTWTSDAEQIFSYAPETAGQFTDPEFRASIVAAIVCFQMIGVWAVAKGLTLIVAYNKGTVREIGPAITHIVAGILVINFPAFFQWVEALMT